MLLHQSVTELGIVNEVMPLQLLNAHSQIDVTEVGITTEVRPVQPLNVLSPIEVIELCIGNEVSPVQPPNTPSWIAVTDSGIVTEVSPPQSKYLEVIEFQLFIINTIEKWMCFLLAYGRKSRFNVFNLILQENVNFGIHNEGNDTIRRMIVRKTVRNKKKP